MIFFTLIKRSDRKLLISLCQPKKREPGVLFFGRCGSHDAFMGIELDDFSHLSSKKSGAGWVCEQCFQDGELPLHHIRASGRIMICRRYGRRCLEPRKMRPLGKVPVRRYRTYRRGQIA